jgi:hypothetical protein
MRTVPLFKNRHLVNYNGGEKEWLQEDWMNYDFFGRNIDN